MSEVSELPAVVPSLALRPREAAKALGISERTLYSLRDKIKPIKLERVVIYPVATLQAWLSEQSGSKASESDTGDK